MSEREFETYLALLGKLLRLSSEQRDAIADELRDHMEQRLEELARQGVPREQAVRTALEEFGDAAGLADEFTRIAHRQHIRRIIMRTSLGTIAAAAVIVLTVSFLMPANRLAVPQNPAALAADADAPAESATDSRLSQPIDLALTDTPLAEAIETLRAGAGMNVYVNWRALEQYNVHSDTPISLQLEDVPVKTAITLVLNSASEHLGYAVRDNVIMISSQDSLIGELDMRIYDCSVLIGLVTADVTMYAPGMPGAMSFGGQATTNAGGYESKSSDARKEYGYGGGYGGHGMEPRFMPTNERMIELMQLMQGSMQAPGRVLSFNGMLIVHTTPEGHDRIDRVLDMLTERIMDRNAELRKMTEDEQREAAQD